MAYQFEDVQDTPYNIPIPERIFDFEYMTGFFNHQVDELVDKHLAEYEDKGDINFKDEFTSLPLFGLIERDYDGESEEDKTLPQWVRFNKYVRRLNDSAPVGVQYRIYLPWRHGLSPHSKYSAVMAREDWQEWACLDNTNLSKKSFFDPETGVDISKEDICLINPSLTTTGIVQARIAGEKWVEYSVPKPDVVYCSPIRRCFQTGYGMLHKVMDGEEEVKFIVVEYLRENMGNHKPHQRNSWAWLRSIFSHDTAIGWQYTREAISAEQIAQAVEEAKTETATHKWQIEFEDGFDKSVEDPICRDVREPVPFIDRRVYAVLNQVFSVGDPTDTSLPEDQQHMVVGLSTHSLTLQAFLRVLKCPKKWKPFPAEMVPMLIKATRVATPEQ